MRRLQGHLWKFEPVFQPLARVLALLRSAHDVLQFASSVGFAYEVKAAIPETVSIRIVSVALLK